MSGQNMSELERSSVGRAGGQKLSSPSGKPPPRERGYVIRPLHVQVATLWLKGNGPKKIGENLSIDERSARRILGELRESARAARKYVQELSRIGYYQKIFNFKQIAAAGHLSQYERVKEGFWPYSDKLVPLGYRVGENRHIEESPEVGPALRRVWKRMLSG